MSVSWWQLCAGDLQDQRRVPPGPCRTRVRSKICSRTTQAGGNRPVLGGVPARTDATETLYIAPMTTNQQILFWIALGIGGGMTYGRWRAERLRARHTMRETWNNRKKARGKPSSKLW